MFKRFDILDKDEVLKKWLNFDDEFGVYVHSPFCPSICKFCIYAGRIYNYDALENYYKNYLPSVINFYKPVLEQKSHLIKTWFFGGGTPSLVPSEKLDEIFNLIPTFTNHKSEKTFELHPGSFNFDIFDVLERHNFTTVVLCQQTLDQSTLKNQNRLPSDLKTLVKLSKECRKRKLKVAVDIISFLNKQESDVKILENDLDLVYKNIAPDELSVQCLYQEKDSFNDLTIDTILKSKFFTEQNYFYEKTNDQNFDLEYVRETYKTLKCFRLFKKNSNLEFNIPQFMDPAWHHGFNFEYSTLAIGSYRNPMTQTHSNIKNFNYIEYNKDNSDFQLKIVSSSYMSEIKHLIFLFEKAGDPPKNMLFKFLTDMYVEKEIPLYLRFDINHNGSAECLLFLQKVDSILKQEKKEILNRLRSNIKEVNFIQNNVL